MIVSLGFIPFTGVCESVCVCACLSCLVRMESEESALEVLRMWWPVAWTEVLLRG